MKTTRKKSKPKYGDDVLEWACFGLMQENEQLKKTIIYYRALIEALQKTRKK